MKNNNRHDIRRQVPENNTEGFTLIELALVMVIIGIIAGSGLSLVKVLTERKARDETLEYLSLVKESLFSYVNIHGALPWASSDTDGIQDQGVASGYLPYLDLKVRPVDSYSRIIKYEVNELLAVDKETTCKALSDGLDSTPLVMDVDGAATAFSVSAVLVSAGPRDADSDGDVFDSVDDTYSGDNTTGSPNYIRYPELDTFDDLIIYIGEGELFSKTGCSGIVTWSVRVQNKSRREVFIHNVTYPSRLVCTGRVETGETKIFKVEDGDAIEIRNGIDYLESHHIRSYPKDTPRTITSDFTFVIKPARLPVNKYTAPGN